MPPSSEFLADHPAISLAPTAPVFYGRRAAAFFGGAAVLALAFLTLLRWTGEPSGVLEKVVQQPIPADAVTSSPRADLAAPDPGD